MFELFQMWAAVEILGLICLPLTMTVFHNLPDRGWAFSKAVGIVLLAFGVWLPLMCLQFLPFSQLFIVGVVCILLAGNLVVFLRMRQVMLKVLRSHLFYLVVTEILFLGMLFLLGWLRSCLPNIQNFENYMDEGFLAAIMRSPHLPPNDMWFAGYSINYYYYAHFTAAMLAKLLGQSPSIIFNTAICLFFGLTAVNLFGVTSNIVSWASYQRICVRTRVSVERPDTVHPSLVRGIPYGLLTVVMCLILGNLAAAQQWWQNRGSGAQYDWFAPSRVIINTINEFPSFSFLLSDFHAHVLTLAFTVLAIGLALNLFLEADGKGLFVFGRGWRLPCTLLVTALVLGGLYTMNGWDYPTYLALALVCIAVQQWLAYETRLSLALCLDVITAAICLGALSFLLYLPFYFHFISPAQGIGIVDAGSRSSLHDELLIYGLFAFVFLSFLFISVFKRPLFPAFFSRGDDETASFRINWSSVGLIGTLPLLLAGVLLLIFMRNSATFVVATSIVILGVILLFYTIGDRAHAFALLLGTVAFALVAFSEIFFLRDVFAGNLPRMNTVFKLYFQAWTLLSLACGVGLFFLVESLRSVKIALPVWRWTQRVGQALWVICLLVLVVAGGVYPLLATGARYGRLNPTGQGISLQSTNSLDGLNYLQTDPANPGDYAAIRWLNANVQGDPAIIEAIGGEYSNAGRVSVFTGLPSPINWSGHEYQWRVNWLNAGANSAEFQRRATDVDTIYTSTNSALVLSLMAHYGAQYIYVGPIEYAKYAMQDLHHFSNFMQVVYNADGVTIYKVK